MVGGRDVGVGVLEGTIIVIYIHTRAHRGWLMGKQAGQGGGEEEGGRALPLHTEQRIRDSAASLSGPKNTTVCRRRHQDAEKKGRKKNQSGNDLRPPPLQKHLLFIAASLGCLTFATKIDTCAEIIAGSLVSDPSAEGEGLLCSFLKSNSETSTHRHNCVTSEPVERRSARRRFNRGTSFKSKQYLTYSPTD